MATRLSYNNKIIPQPIFLEIPSFHGITKTTSIKCHYISSHKDLFTIYLWLGDAREA